MFVPLILMAFAIMAWVFAPVAWLAAVILVGIVWLFVQYLQLDAAVREPEIPFPAGNGAITAPSIPFVSIHVATYDEPPALVIDTLRSLLALDYPQFEVIVLDNNTIDPKVWRPVARFCARHPDKLRFFHHDAVEGAKAGALNLCLKVMNPSTEVVAVVDADYRVEPHFLKVGIAALRRSGSAFVQFPQAYRGITDEIRPIAAELEDYFNAFARRANDSRSMLLTGTLSLIAVKPLIDVGGWNAATITEDAELGLRLFAAGYDGHFVDNIAGKGLLPLDFQGLRDQRARWVCGNAQTIAKMFRSQAGVLTRRGVKSVFTQLTAWPALLALPIMVLFLGALPLPTSPLRGSAINLSAMMVLASLLVTAIRMAITVSLRGQPLGLVCEAVVVKWSLMWSSSTCWIKTLTTQSLAFVKTPKSAGDRQRLSVPNMMLASFALVALGSHASTGHALASVACLVLAATVPAAMWVDARLSAYKPDIHAVDLISVRGAVS